MAFFSALKRICATILAVVFMLAVTGCAYTEVDSNSESYAYTEADSDSEIDEYIINKNGYSISTASQEATMVGAAVLEAGGNAVDATIAIAYTLGVVEAYGSGVGGGGGMLIYDPYTDEFTFINFISTAAISGATSNDISVPGFVAGMELAYELYGTQDYSELLSYAIDYAENGFICGSELAVRAAAYIDYFSPSNPFYDISEGDIIVQAELAQTLKAIAKEGSSAFYSGSIAEQIIAATDLTASDLEAYQAYTDEAVISSVAGYTIASAPAPFSGLTVIQMLKLMELMNVPDPDDDNEAYISDLVAIKTAATSLNDSIITDVSYTSDSIDYDALLTDSYLLELVDTQITEYSTSDEGTDTTHISVIDSSGMTVSMTTTISSFWGSKTYVAGFFMGNNLRIFNSNTYAAGKAPKSFMSPTILLGENGDIMAIGSPGGVVIPSVIVSVLSDIILYGTNAQDAVNKARIFIDSETTIAVEIESDYDLIANPSELENYTIKTQPSRYFGSVNIAGYSASSGFYGTSDPHRLGYGYASNELSP